MLQLHPFGMTVAGEGQKPLLLMKDESGEITLPVPLNPLEAGITLSQSNKATVPMTPHRGTELLLQSMGVRISRCLFKEVRSGNLMVELEIENHPLKTRTIELKAEEAMSFCLHMQVPIFATRELIFKSRAATAEDQALAQKLAMDPRLMKRHHQYLM